MESRKKRRNIGYIENKRDKKQNKKSKYICLIMAAVMIFIYYQVYILVNYTIGRDVTESQIWLYKWMVNKVNKEDVENKTTNVDIAVLGNIKVKGELLESYSNRGTVNYSSIFENISFEDYDYTIANLNTSIVLDSKPEGKFYANTKLIKELKNINIDMLVMANQELGIQKEKTIEETLKEIRNNGLNYIGASMNNTSYPYYILDKNDIKIAILAYVDGDYTENSSLNVYNKKQIKEDIKEVKKEKADVIIAFVDTLRSNQNNVKDEKKNRLQDILDEGVDIVISNDVVEQKLYYNTEKTKYIKYSLGDVIGLQEADNGDVSKVLKISVNKEVKDGKMSISFEVDEDKTLVALSNADMTKYKVVDLDKEILNFDETSDKITVAEYKYLKKVKESIK